MSSMKRRDTIISSTRTGIQRVLSLSSKKPSRNSPTNTAEAVGSLTLTAQSAASTVNAIPGTDIKTEVHAVLEVIKSIDSKKAGDEKIRAQLEDHVRYLTELLEPLIRMGPSQITPSLRREMHKLAKELHAISALNLDPESSSGVLRRRLSFIKRPRNYDEEIHVFTQDLKTALNRFRVAALPMYTVSVIEMALFSLGITVDFSECDLLPFLEAIVQHEHFMDYRLGTVQSVHLYRDDRVGHGGLHEFLLIGLLNKHGVENWVRLEPHLGPKRGEVRFATKPEKLVMAAAATRERLIVEDRLPITRLAVEIKAICENEDTSKYSTRRIFESLAPHGRSISTPISFREHRELFELPLSPLSYGK